MYEDFFDSPDESRRAAIVRELMERGHSNASAANLLNVTPGTIAGIRWRHDIPSTHAPPSMRRASEEGKPKPPYKLASSPASACVERWEDGRPCEFVREEGKKRCKLHEWMRRAKRGSA